MNTLLRFTAVILLLGATTVQGIAQIKDVKFESVKFQKIIDKSLVPSLESDIPGIVDGSIYNIVLCRKYFSSLNFTTANAKLKWVIAENASPSLCYKAHLALIYLEHADEITIAPVSKAESTDYIFRQISDELKAKMLVISGSIVQK